MPYVDAFVVTVPKESLEAYKATARIAGKFGRSSERSPIWSARR
jgi:uncharacterized protein YbaA (DUF1428 family)